MDNPVILVYDHDHLPQETDNIDPNFLYLVKRVYEGAKQLEMQTLWLRSMPSSEEKINDNCYSVTVTKSDYWRATKIDPSNIERYFLVFHAGEEDTPLCWKDIKEIVLGIQVSSEGRRSCRHTLSDNGKPLLQLVPSHHDSLMEGDAWKIILGHVQDDETINKIINGNTPVELKRYFHRRPYLFLPAFSCLTQAFLSVYFVIKEFPIIDQNTDIGKALLSMGAEKLKHLNDEDKNRLRMMSERVQSKEYWQVIQDKEALGTLHTELEGMDDVSRKSITDILAVIKDNKPLKLTNPEPVAKAYYAICTFLK